MVIPPWKSALLGRFTAIQFENVIGYGDGTKKLMIGSIVFAQYTIFATAVTTGHGNTMGR